HRGRAAGAQYGARHGGGRAAVRGTLDRDVGPIPGPERVRSEPGLKPDVDDPGADRAAGLDRLDRPEAAPVRPRHSRELRTSRQTRGGQRMSVGTLAVTPARTVSPN